VSDASGQLEDELDPLPQVGAVLNRTTSVLMDRVREEQLLRLLRLQAPVAFIHLLTGLSPRKEAWSNTLAISACERGASELLERTDGIDTNVQELIACFRTDLDSFTDIEAFSLMHEGYRLSESVLRKALGIRDLIREPRCPKMHWRFLAIAPWLAYPTPAYLSHLRLARHRLFKLRKLSWLVFSVAILLPVATFTIGTIGLVMEEGITGLFSIINLPTRMHKSAFVVFIISLVLSILTLTVGVVGVRGRPRWLFSLVARPPQPGFGTALIWQFVWLHLAVLNPIFLWQGRLERLGQHVSVSKTAQRDQPMLRQ
jgi:hypothetical protein